MVDSLLREVVHYLVGMGRHRNVRGRKPFVLGSPIVGTARYLDDVGRLEQVPIGLWRMRRRAVHT